MILDPGTFNTKEYRKNIPAPVKLAVLIRQQCKDLDGQEFTVEEAMSGGIQFDHRPALCFRPYDTVEEDFVPRQNDPEHIDARRRGAHAEETYGRKEGAEKTGSTRGSDIAERARTIRIKDDQALAEARQLSKQGDYVGAAAALSRVQLKKNKRPKKKIQSRPFSSQHRPLRAA